MTATRRTFLALAAASGLALPACADEAWESVAARAKGQVVAWNAWAGDERTNAFIAWTNERMRVLYDVGVQHVRLRDTSEAVARVVAERAAGRDAGGSVDLIWINGPNFLSMKQAGLLSGPVVDRLPHATLIDRVGKPATMTDFTVPVDGFEVPWRMAQIVFLYDSAMVAEPPRSMAAMLDWARAHPGRLAHPTARNFLGATFLKQALLSFAPDRAALQRPVVEAEFGPATAALWDWYGALRPLLWRSGRIFPESGAAQAGLLDDGEIFLSISFNPAEAATAIAQGRMSRSVRTYVLDGGTIGNCSFNAIPYNAAHKEAAMLLADFLLSPEAQARQMDPRLMGSATVLDLSRLSAADRKLFDDLPHSPALLTTAELGVPLAEPHPSWMTRLVAEWERRVTA